MTGINAVVTADSMGANKCHWCGMYHGPKCPSVAAIEYHENGQVKRVEFFGAPRDAGYWYDNGIQKRYGALPWRAS